MTTPIPSRGEAFLQRMIDALGGEQAFLDALRERREEFDRAWNQDTDRIGRVLRAHLAVEHFLSEYLQKKNPNLGSLLEARLSYAQKVELLGSGDIAVGLVIPGLRRLGQIRNRLAHRLTVDVTEDDERLFLGIAAFRAMREAEVERFGPDPSRSMDARVAVLEDFAKFAAGLFHSYVAPHADAWDAAFGSGLAEDV